MKHTHNKIRTMIRTSFTLFFITLGLSILFAPAIISASGLTISQNADGQNLTGTNITLADYSFFFWVDNDLYVIQSDMEATNLIRPQFTTYHDVDPETLVSQLDQPTGENELNSSFSSPHFSFHSRIAPVSYKLSGFSH